MVAVLRNRLVNCVIEFGLMFIIEKKFRIGTVVRIGIFVKWNMQMY